MHGTSPGWQSRQSSIRAADPPVDGELVGLDEWTAGIMRDLYQRVGAGGFAVVSPVVEAVTGRAPCSVQEFIAEHRTAWLA
ncbi:hypothetical protein [Solicola gregarius]|uniref:Uncharacterized protein n=1 Tax=Solicola gregarius TaxID=2908642 RepID=A0AA46YN45_9ACTN|nr:hypothetical protein [Solicola gregarius]UYM07106.1 hypothetical protein L0C25_08530 [Solicola gregarius]